MPGNDSTHASDESRPLRQWLWRREEDPRISASKSRQTTPVLHRLRALHRTRIASPHAASRPLRISTEASDGTSDGQLLYSSGVDSLQRSFIEGTVYRPAVPKRSVMCARVTPSNPAAPQYWRRSSEGYARPCSKGAGSSGHGHEHASHFTALCSSLTRIRTVLNPGRASDELQRPGIAAQVEADLHILRYLLHRALIEYPEVAAIDPKSLLSEFARTMSEELDFRQEAENMRRFRRNFADSDSVYVPSPCDELVTARVLGMERLNGIPIRKARAAGHDMAVVGDRYLNTLFEMVLTHGFFHGDLHPGNVFVLPGNVIGLLDCGMVGSATEKMRTQIATMMFALQRGDYRTLSRILYDIAIRDERLDFRALQDATIEVTATYFPPGVRLEDIAMGPFSMELLRRAAELGAQVPTPYIMVLKALITAEGLAKSLLHEVDLIAAGEPYFTALATRRLAPERLEQEALYAVLTASSLVDRLPVTFAQLLDDLDDQRLQVSVKPVSNPETLQHAARQSDRQIAAAFGVGTLLTGGVLATALPPAPLLGLPVATTVLWTVTVAIGLVLLIRRQKG